MKIQTVPITILIRYHDKRFVERTISNLSDKFWMMFCTTRWRDIAPGGFWTLGSDDVDAAQGIRLAIC